MRRQHAPGRVRIISGRWRSLRIPVAAGIRPTPDKVRESVFSVLGSHLAGASVVDLFAGCGCLGFEALSRGAKSVQFVEINRRAAAGIREYANILGVSGRCKVAVGNAHTWLGRQDNAQYTIAFVDPPYHHMQNPAERAKLLGSLHVALAKSCGIAYLETPVRLEEKSAGWNIIRRGHCGSAHWTLLQAGMKL